MENHKKAVMKIKTLATLLACIISLRGIAQNKDLTIYDSLRFEKKVASKTVVVDYKCLGRDPIATTNASDSIIAAINNSIRLRSETAMEFSYNNKDYYISIHDKCMRKALSLNKEKIKRNIESIKVMITIAFYENIYYRGEPYAVITNIKRKY
ncbi:MAG: hypothetical protein J5526_04185 [Bacteroidales bacterium]|nr:hypothetical protein [Bacteroidales bacterium]